MKWLLAVFAFLLFTTLITAEDQATSKKQIVYPDDLTSLSYLLNMVPELPSSEREEYVEVKSDYYPGLEFALPTPEERLSSFQKTELKVFPPGPEYFLPGGPVLYYYGIYAPSGQLFSVPVDNGKKK
jgi:hypothetical protein